MSGSWNPDAIMKRYVEESNKIKQSKSTTSQSTISSSSNPQWYQNVQDMLNKSKSTQSSSNAHLQSSQHFFDHCKRKLVEEKTTIKFNSKRRTLEQKYSDESFRTLEEVDNYKLPSKFVSNSDQLLREVCNFNEINVENEDSSSENNNEDENNTSEEDRQVNCSESLHNFVKSSMERKPAPTIACARSCCQSSFNHSNDTEIKNSVFRQTIMEISVLLICMLLLLLPLLL